MVYDWCLCTSPLPPLYSFPDALLFQWMRCCLSELPEVNRPTATQKKTCNCGRHDKAFGISELNRLANTFGFTHLTFALKFNYNPSWPPHPSKVAWFSCDVSPGSLWCLFLLRNVVMERCISRFTSIQSQDAFSLRPKLVWKPCRIIAMCCLPSDSMGARHATRKQKKAKLKLSCWLEPLLK